VISFLGVVTSLLPTYSVFFFSLFIQQLHAEGRQHADVVGLLMIFWNQLSLAMVALGKGSAVLSRWVWH